MDSTYSSWTLMIILLLSRGTFFYEVFFFDEVESLSISRICLDDVMGSCCTKQKTGLRDCDGCVCVDDDANNRPSVYAFMKNVFTVEDQKTTTYHTTKHCIVTILMTI
jgi:hypothetical protein